MVSFNRSPTWITPEFAAEFAPEGRESVFSEEQKAHWTNNPKEFLEFRKKIENHFSNYFGHQFKNTPFQEKLYQHCRETMEKTLKGKPELASITIPSFAVGCRR